MAVALRQSTVVLALVVCALLCSAPTASAQIDTWRTAKHESGVCALYGTAGHRPDGDALDRPQNTRAQRVSEDSYGELQASCPQLVSEFGGENGTYCCDARQIHDLSTKIQQGLIFLLGCPACAHNFRHFFCTLTCSPNQSLFANVTDVQTAQDTNMTAVKQVDYFVTDAFGDSFYNSCKDVVFSVANQKAMTFVGGGAANWTQWAEFLGLVKDKRFPHAGSPFQMDFPGEAATPTAMAPMDERLPACWDPVLRCSCGDCPDAPQCEPPEPPPVIEPPHCIPGVPGLRCGDLGLLVLYAAVLVLLYKWFQRQDKASAATAEHALRYDASSPLLGEGWQLEPDHNYPFIEQRLRQHLRWQGEYCARNPREVLIGCCVAVLILSLGLFWFRVETDPQRLWVGRGSRALADKQAYEAAFGPFYRIEQLIISTQPGDGGNASDAILTDANIKLLFDIQAEVDSLRASDSGNNAASLAEVCYKPFGEDCATQSLLQYWQMNRTIYEQGFPPHHTKLSPEFCFDHWSTQCRAAFGGPIDPHLVLGGFPMDASFGSYSADATSFIVTYPLDSSPDKRASAMAWEAAFVRLASGNLTAMCQAAGLRLSYSAERSVEDELSRESSTDASTVLLSYLAMLLYIAVALTSLPRGAHWRALLVRSRLGLGIGGVAIVAASVTAALGLCSAFGMWSTLIIMEVIPFLILAVGVDNLFIISQALDRQPIGAPLPARMGAALAAAGPSITLAAASETLAFGLAALTPMPAVRNFSLVAAVAVAIDYALQVTAFVALLALDTERIAEGRLDCAPCVCAPAAAQLSWDMDDDPPPAAAENGGYQSLADYGLPSVGGARTGSSALSSGAAAGEGLGLQAALKWYIARVHAPALMRPAVQVAVLALFLGAAALSAAVLPRISVGLDQRVALPRDSYLQAYFGDVTSALRVGPPLFLVVRDLNLSTAAPDVDRVCSVAGCDDGSLVNQVAKAARSPASSYIASPAASWLDDFLGWVSPEVGQCCREFPHDAGDGYCPPPDQPPCAADVAACQNCSTCFRAAGAPGPDLLVNGRPDPAQMQARLPWFMEARPSAACAKGGAGAYSDALQRDADDPGGVAGLQRGVIAASAFRTSYVPLSRQTDFIDGFKVVTATVDRLSEKLGLSIFSFSVFHVFFEQYLSIARDSLHILGTAGLAVLAVCWLMTGSLWASALMLAAIAMVLLDMGGAMYLAGIQLNAVSLVNLTMALGIAVEFCAHPVHAFMEASGDRPARTAAALRSAGASVLCGIALTKLIGVLVLAFARTQIFEVYFFRMYLALVVLAAGHGLVLLPVLLSLAGPPPFGSGTGLLEETGIQEHLDAAAASLPEPGEEMTTQ